MLCVKPDPQRPVDFRLHEGRLVPIGPRGGGQEVVADLVAALLYLTTYRQRLDEDARDSVPALRCHGPAPGRPDRRLRSGAIRVQLRQDLVRANLDEASC